MHTQSYLPASGAESGEGTWEGLWGRTICDPGGQEEDLALLGFPALGEQPAFLIYLFPLCYQMVASSRAETGQPCKESQNPLSTLTQLVCGWVQAIRTGTPRDGEVGIAWPPSTFLLLMQAQRRRGRELSELQVPLVAHNSGMHMVWQPGSRALFDHQSHSPGPMARLWTLAASGTTSLHKGSLHS